MIIKIKTDGRLPKYGYDDDCAADIFLQKDYILQPNVMNKIPLGLCVDIPRGFEGNLRSRTSSLMKGIIVHSPSIDPGYTGEIHALISILGDKPMLIKKDQRICSLIITPFVRGEFKYKEYDKKEARKFNGFGSTGE